MQYSIPFAAGNAGGGGGCNGGGGGSNSDGGGNSNHVGFNLTRVPQIQQGRRTVRGTVKRKDGAFDVPSGNADGVVYSIPMVDLGGSKAVAEDLHV